jgi:drug/metabolite transporter (DMT)-like permease
LAGVFFLGEPMTWRLMIGGGFIISGLLAISLLNARSMPQP